MKKLLSIAAAFAVSAVSVNAFAGGDIEAGKALHRRRTDDDVGVERAHEAAVHLPPQRLKVVAGHRREVGGEICGLRTDEVGHHRGAVEGAIDDEEL